MNTAIARQRIASDVYTLPILWGIFVLGVAAVVASVALFGTVTRSAWEVAAGVSRWFIGAVAVYMTAAFLPLYIAHGYTRREFGAQVLASMLVFAAALSLLMTAGYGLEGVIYRALGWPWILERDHLFTTPSSLHLVLMQFALVHVVWASAGALLGAAFYRDGRLGAVLIIPALGAVGLTGLAIGSELPLPGNPGPGHVAVLVLALAVLAVASTWLIIRDIPVRSRKS